MIRIRAVVPEQTAALIIIHKKKTDTVKQ
jgi:hypothetical protein